MKVYFLDLGYAYFNLNTLANVHGEGVVRGRSPQYAILIDHPSGKKILIDCSFHPESMRGRWTPKRMFYSPYYYTPAQTMENQLALIGLGPEQIDIVLISHTHIDHTGYLYLFPQATVYVNPKEFPVPGALEWLQASVEDREKMPSYKEFGISDDLCCPIEKYVFVEDEPEIVEGVKIIQLPGHSPGQMGFLLDLENTGKVILASDAAHLSANYGPPVQIPPPNKDDEGYLASMEKIRRLQKETNAKILFGHDYEQFKKIKFAPFYYD